jgi:hypothetical protein
METTMDKDGLDQSLNELLRILGLLVAGPEDEDDDDDEDEEEDDQDEEDDGTEGGIELI